MKYLLPLLLLLPLLGCAALSNLSETAEAIQAETTVQLEELDEAYTSGAVTASERDMLLREILEASQARLDAAARAAGDSMLGTGNDLFELLMLVLLGGGGTAGALSIKRRVTGPRE